MKTLLDHATIRRAGWLTLTMAVAYTALLAPVFAQSQNIQREVYSAAGSSFENADIRFSQTIGEPFGTTLSTANPSRFIIQGFEQPVIEAAPAIECLDITVSLDATANAAVDELDLTDGSYDFSEAFTIVVSPNTFDCTSLGVQPVFLAVTYLTGQVDTCTSYVTIVDPLNVCCTSQSVAIGSGWNLISSYIQPDVPDMLDVLSGIASEMVLIKDESGTIAVPSISLNLIGDWSVTEGYLLKSNAATTLEIGCTQVVPEEVGIPLQAGWNIIPYLRTDAMDPAIALSGLGDTLILVKDNDGAIFVPAILLNQIGSMQPGQGYFVKVTENATLIYPANTARYGLIDPESDKGDR